MQHFGYTHLSAGELLREERNNPESEVGQLIADHIKEGKIVPVKITCSLLEKVGDSSKCIYGLGKFLFIVSHSFLQTSLLCAWETHV